jgi:hypothetical protein
MTLHKQVWIDDTEVDEGIASLLKVLWLRGYRTLMSCQGGNMRDDDHDHSFIGRSYIVFSNYNYAHLFHSKTVKLLVKSVPDYWGFTDPHERINKGSGVLYDTHLQLTAMDPYDTPTLRGKVEWDYRALQRITKVWARDDARL